MSNKDKPILNRYNEMRNRGEKASTPLYETMQMLDRYPQIKLNPDFENLSASDVCDYLQSVSGHRPSPQIMGRALNLLKERMNQSKAVFEAVTKRVNDASKVQVPVTPALSLKQELQEAKANMLAKKLYGLNGENPAAYAKLMLEIASNWPGNPLDVVERELNPAPRQAEYEKLQKEIREVEAKERIIRLPPGYIRLPKGYPVQTATSETTKQTSNEPSRANRLYATLKLALDGDFGPFVNYMHPNTQYAMVGPNGVPVKYKDVELHNGVELPKEQANQLLKNASENAVYTFDIKDGKTISIGAKDSQLAVVVGEKIRPSILLGMYGNQVAVEGLGSEDPTGFVKAVSKAFGGLGVVSDRYTKVSYS